MQWIGMKAGMIRLLHDVLAASQDYNERLFIDADPDDEAEFANDPTPETILHQCAEMRAEQNPVRKAG